MNDDELESEFIIALGRPDRDGDPGQDGKGIHRLGVGGPGIRHVRTPAGATYYDQPMGSVITKDQINRVEREKGRLGIKPPKGGLTDSAHAADHPAALHQPGMPKTPAQQAARAKLEQNAPKLGALSKRAAAVPGPKPQPGAAPLRPAPVKKAPAAAPGTKKPLAPGVKPVLPGTKQIAGAAKPPTGKPIPGAPKVPAQPARDMTHEIKNTAPTINGPLRFKVAGKEFGAPEGSKIFRSTANTDGLAFVRSTDGNVHVFNDKGEVTVPHDVQEIFKRRFAGALKNDPNYHEDKFDNAGKVPELGDAKAGAALKEGDSTVFQRTEKGSWKHTDLGTEHQDGEVSDAYKSGQLSYHPAGGADLSSMDRETFSKTIRSMPEGKTLQFANPGTGDVKALKKTAGAWTTEDGKPMSEASMFFLRKHLSGEDNPDVQKKVAKATKEAVKKPTGARPSRQRPSTTKPAAKPAATAAKKPAAKKATPAAKKPAAKKPAAKPAEKKAPEEILRSSAPFRDATGAQTRWATEQEAHHDELRDQGKMPLHEGHGDSGPAPKTEPAKELSGREKLKQAAPPHTKAAEDLKPGDRFGGGTIHSVGPHPDEKMQHKVLVHFKDKNGELRRTEWGKRTQIAIHKDEHKAEEHKPEAPKVEHKAEPAAEAAKSTAKHPAGRGLGPLELKDLTPGARVRGTFRAPSGSGTGDSDTRYYKHWDGSFRHIGEDVSPPHTAHEIALHHSGKNRKLVLEEDNKGGHFDHPQVGDDATPAWAKEAQPGHTIVEKHGQYGDEHTNWTKQHDGSWLSDNGEVLSDHEIGQGDHWRMSIGPHHDLAPDHELEHADATPVPSGPHEYKHGQYLTSNVDHGEQLVDHLRNIAPGGRISRGGGPIRPGSAVQHGTDTLEKQADGSWINSKVPDRKLTSEEVSQRNTTPHGAHVWVDGDHHGGHRDAHQFGDAPHVDKPVDKAPEPSPAELAPDFNQDLRDHAPDHPTQEPDGHPDVPKGSDLKMGDSIPSTDWIRNAQVGTKVEYVRRDGQRSQYTRISQQEWESPRGTRIPAAHMEEPRKLSLWRFVSAPSDSHPMVGSAKDSAKQAGTLTAEWFASQPDGSQIERNGQTFLKRDGKWVSEDGKNHGPGDMVNLLNN